jgi:glycerol 3-phosphatase-2
VNRPGEALVAAYRAIACDLDGVVYRGARAVPFAVSSLQASQAYTPVVFATNNASRTPTEVAGQLEGLGLTGTGADAVVTSAQAGAALLRSRLGPGAVVLAVGGDGVAEALADAELRPMRTLAARPEAVLQGWARTVTVADLADASLAVADGALWVATNTDLTLPTEAGVVPGNGTLVAAVASASGRRPLVVGKPERGLYDTVAARVGVPVEGLLAIGDRLNTDVLGAMRLGVDSVWVLTGVDGFAELAASDVVPTWALPDLQGLLCPPVEVSGSAPQWSAGRVTARLLGDGRVTINGADEYAVHAPAVAALGRAVVLALREAGDRHVVQVGVTFDRALGALREGAPGQYGGTDPI